MNQLHPIAQAVQSQGRGRDTQLVHMTPNEVAGLQALAMANGGSLSINPNTGLPEAGFLESLLPTILGAGLAAATGGSSLMIGAGLGALQYARTGSLEKGLMAGLGAYGGAGLGASLAGAGATAGSEAMKNLAAEQAKQQAAAAAAKDVATREAAQLAAKKAGEELALQQANTLGAGTFSQNLSNMGTGLKTAFSSPTTFMEQFGGSGMDLAKTAGAAAAPTLLQQPRTVMPPSDNEQYQYDYDPGRVSEEDLARQREENPYGELTYFRPTYGPRRTVRVAQGGELRYADGGSYDYKYDPVTQTYKKVEKAPTIPTGPTGAVTPIGIDGGRSDDGPQLSKGQIDFLDKEAATPGARDARMGKISEIIGLLAPGSIARGIVGGLNSVTGGGVVAGPGAPVVDRSTYSPAAIAEANAADAAVAASGDAGQAASVSGDTAGVEGIDPGSMGWKDGGLLALANGGMSKGGFVVPADVVSALGNGSTDAGLRTLQAKMGAVKPIKGQGDGLSDSIKTSIDGKQPARVADGEAYIPPATVAKIGGGDPKKGAKKLYAMMDKIRQQAHGKKSQQRRVNPNTAI